MGTVKEEQIKKLKSLIDETSSLICQGICKLFLYSNKKDSKKWVYTQLSGALTLLIDRTKGGAAIFRLYDLNQYITLFEYEMYYDFHLVYQQLNEQNFSFYYFPIQGDFFLGFSFADSNEAMHFQYMVTTYSPKNIQKQRNATEKLTIQEKEFIDKLLLNKKIKEEINLNNIAQNQKQDKITIYKPTNFRKLEKLEWDFKNNCIDFSKLSKEYKQIFQAAGIKKKELENMETALKIYELILVKENEKPVQNPPSKKFTTYKKDSDNPLQSEEKKQIEEIKNTPTKQSIYRSSSKKEISRNEELESNIIPIAPTIKLQPVIQNSPTANKGFNQQISQQSSNKTQENANPSHPVQQNNRTQILQQIQQGKFKLRHVDLEEEEEKKREIIQQQSSQQNDLTFQLAQVINARRIALNKYNKQDSESSSGWNDSD